MGKKNKNDKKNNTPFIVGVSVLGVVALYFASSYSGLLSGKLYTGGDTEVATALDCSWSTDNTIKAKLTVSGVRNNPAALDVASALQAETIIWIIPESSSTTNPAISVTDEQGNAQTKFTPSAGVATPVITALFPGDKIQIDAQKNEGDTEVTTHIVEYGQASCEIPNPN